MKALKLTQVKLANEMKRTRFSIAHYVSGRRTPSMRQFSKLASILQCEPAWLQYGEMSNSLPHKVKPTKAPSKGNGGKLNRSAIIQARIDPKLHMAAEIMAHYERRTLSSLIETLILKAIEKYKIRVSLPVDGSGRINQMNSIN